MKRVLVIGIGVVLLAVSALGGYWARRRRIEHTRQANADIMMFSGPIPGKPLEEHFITLHAKPKIRTKEHDNYSHLERVVTRWKPKGWRNGTGRRPGRRTPAWHNGSRSPAIASV